MEGRKEKSVKPATVKRGLREPAAALFAFYYEGFKGMTVGRRLWGIVLVKLFVILVVVRLFFMPDFLESRFATDEQRAAHVLECLTPAAGAMNGGRHD